MKHLYLIKEKIERSLKEHSDIKHAIYGNKILDDSYIYRTQINSKFIERPCIMNLYQYGGIFDDPKTYATFRLLETFMNLQFSKYDLVSFDTSKLEDFEQSILAIDGNFIVTFKIKI